MLTDPIPPSPTRQAPLLCWIHKRQRQVSAVESWITQGNSSFQSEFQASFDMRWETARCFLALFPSISALRFCAQRTRAAALTATILAFSVSAATLFACRATRNSAAFCSFAAKAFDLGFGAFFPLKDNTSTDPPLTQASSPSCAQKGSAAAARKARSVPGSHVHLARASQEASATWG